MMLTHLLIFAALRSVAARPPQRSANSVTPISKVLELLDVLTSQLNEDGAKDGSAFANFSAWSQNASSIARHIIKTNEEAVVTLQASIAEKQTFIEAAGRQIDTTISDLAHAEKDLDVAKATREQENKDFRATETTLMEAVDQLERSLIVLSDNSAVASTPASPTLLSVARNLKVALMQGAKAGDLQLSLAQRETLGMFLHAAEASERETSARVGRRVASVDFLQVRSLHGDPKGDYERQSDGVASLLKNLLETASQQLAEARMREVKRKNEFVAFSTSIQSEIDNKKKTLTEIKFQVAFTQQALSQQQGQLGEVQQVLKSTTAELDEIVSLTNMKSLAYKARVQKRSDEIMAVQEAKQVLTTEIAQKLLSPEQSPDPAEQKSTSFLQLNSTRQTRKSRPRAKVALIALGARIRHQRAASNEDPFGKVKGLIQNLLDKLSAEHSKDAEKKAWCDTELGRNLKMQASKQAAIQKLSGRIAVMDGELAQLEIDVRTASDNLAEITAITEKAAQTRNEESVVAVAGINQYKDAQELLKTAISVLKKFYSQATASQGSQDVPAGEQYEAKAGLSGGVIALLEIALQDYGDLQKETEAAEAESAKAFEELMNESKVRMAVFQKDYEYAARGVTKGEAERMRANSDLQGYTSELQAINEYLEKVQASCVSKAETYEERKTRRDAELQSLQEALDFLSSER